MQAPTRYDCFRGNLFKIASNNLNVNLISDEELTQKRQDFVKVMLEAYLKARQIENYEECVTFRDNKLYGFLVKFW